MHCIIFFFIAHVDYIYSNQLLRNILPVIKPDLLLLQCFHSIECVNWLETFTQYKDVAGG